MKKEDPQTASKESDVEGREFTPRQMAAAKSIGASEYYGLQASRFRGGGEYVKKFGDKEADGILLWENEPTLQPTREYTVGGSYGSKKEWKAAREKIRDFLDADTNEGKELLLKEVDVLRSHYSRGGSSILDNYRVSIRDEVFSKQGGTSGQEEIGSVGERKSKAGLAKLYGFFTSALEDGSIQQAMQAFYDCYSHQEVTRSGRKKTVELKSFDRSDWQSPDRIATHFTMSDLAGIGVELGRIRTALEQVAAKGSSASGIEQDKKYREAISSDKQLKEVEGIVVRAQEVAQRRAA